MIYNIDRINIDDEYQNYTYNDKITSLNARLDYLRENKLRASDLQTGQDVAIKLTQDAEIKDIREYLNKEKDKQRYKKAIQRQKGLLQRWYRLDEQIRNNMIVLWNHKNLSTTEISQITRVHEDVVFTGLQSTNWGW